MNSTQYKILPLDSFQKNLAKFPKKSREKINRKISEMLIKKPYDSKKLSGSFDKIGGVPLVGLRAIRISVKGIKNGVRVLYRICEECRKNKYYLKSDVRCDFCDDGKIYRVVLFTVFPRNMGY